MEPGEESSRALREPISFQRGALSFPSRLIKTLSDDLRGLRHGGEGAGREQSGRQGQSINPLHHADLGHVSPLRPKTVCVVNS